MGNKIKDSLEKFFYGRCGLDDLGRFTFVLYLILFVMNLATSEIIFYYIELVLVILFLYRCLSKNLTKRYQENARYLACKNSVLRFFRIQKRRWTDRRTHVYRKCPNCHTTVRLPKIKGSHTATCPKCGKDFNVKV